VLRHEMFILSWKHPKDTWTDLYKQGLTDYELANTTGASLRTIRRWRSENNIPCNAKKTQLERIDKTSFMALYMMCYTDIEIAKKQNCSKTIVREWRQKHNLKPRGRKGFRSDGSYAGRIFQKGQHINKGEKHWNWKGGVSFRNERQFYWQIEWKTLRDAVFKRDDYSCRICIAQSRRVVAHHIIPRREAPNLALDPTNLITLCDAHHIFFERSNPICTHCHRRLLAEEIARRFGAEYKGEVEAPAHIYSLDGKPDKFDYQ